MTEALILEYVRTPIGRYGGGLSTVRPDDLAAHVVRAVVDRSGIPADQIDDIYFGNANGAGEDNRNVARMAALLAGLPVETPGVTVNRLCASGLEAAAQAARAVMTGDAQLVLAGGVESMSRAPFVYLKAEQAFQRGPVEVADTTIGWRFINPEMKYSTEGMGSTAENVAERYGISREDQDAYAARSHSRAATAWENGVFDAEVVPVEVPQRKAEPVNVVRDEGIRPDSSVETLSKLRPAFRENGVVTAGNSSQINDGAACLAIGSAATAEQFGIAPIARVVATVSAGIDPAFMGVGPIPATKKLLQRTGLSIDQIDRVELNEAFASQVLACARELEIPEDKLNVNGGGIALGHPLGCSGARLIGTLARELQRSGGRYGIATLCIGVGQGLATLIENPAAGS